MLLARDWDTAEEWSWCEHSGSGAATPLPCAGDAASAVSGSADAQHCGRLGIAAVVCLPTIILYVPQHLQSMWAVLTAAERLRQLLQHVQRYGRLELLLLNVASSRPLDCLFAALMPLPTTSMKQYDTVTD